MPTRLRVAANTQSSRRSGLITFRAGSDSINSTNLEINQDGAAAPVTYSGGGSQGSLQYVGAGSNCQYRTTISDINVSVTFPRAYDGTGSLTATSGTLTLTADETSSGICTIPALGVSRHTYALREGTHGNTFLVALFALTSGRPSTIAELRVSGGGSPGGGNLYVTRTDASGPLNWTVVVTGVSITRR